MDDIKKSLDSQFIYELFGTNSEIYLQSLEFLKDQAEKQKLYERKFKDWKRIFTSIYGNEISLTTLLDNYDGVLIDFFRGNW